MGGFSAQWLELREPFDSRARSQELVIALGSLLPLRPLQVLDFGAGTGANVRYMAPLLEGRQHWQTLDNDRELIARQPSQLADERFECNVSPQHFDLAAGLESLPLSGCQLVTASALLDLVSAAWLESLAFHCAALGLPALFSLNYDGRVQCLPEDPDDSWIIALVNRHQRLDKGFGPALGPDATSHACRVFESRGFQSRTTPSDWVIGPEGQSLQRELIAGWVAAACEMAPQEATCIEQWGKRRHAHAEAGRSRIQVGHQDFLAWPKALCG
ncbi:hypothetical protein [Povalibacter sp.]|uniref:hypothetical protein n=1 Tax=Povalibacter sp. TaxID=1962978 RepID=UPI002F40732A